LTAAIHDHVTFRDAADPLLEPMDAAADFVRHAKTKGIKVRAHRSYSGAVTVRVYRQGDRFHTVGLAATADGRLLARHNVAAGRDLSMIVHAWLTDSGRFSDICWRTRDEWKNGGPGRDTPI
jgi:hypothetical protein